MILLIVSVSIGLLLFGIGFLVNDKNATSVISDFNAMSKDEKEEFRLSSYVQFFRLFHFIVGISIILFSIIFFLLNLIDYIGFTLIFFSLPGYTFFILRSQYFFPKDKRALYKVSAMIMIIISLGVFVLTIVMQLNPNIEVFDDQLRISGVYGEQINLSDIEDINLLENYPPIKIKVNGIAMTNIKKGWFRLKDGRKVKLFINDSSGPYVYIKTIDERIIIIGIKDYDDSILYQQLRFIKQQSSE